MIIVLLVMMFIDDVMKKRIGNIYVWLLMLGFECSSILF